MNCSMPGLPVHHQLPEFTQTHVHPLSMGFSRQEWWSGLPFPLSCESHSVMFDSLQPHGLYSPWNSLGQNTRMDSLSLLQGIFLTQRLNPGLLHCRWIFYQLSHKGNPVAPPPYNGFISRDYNFVTGFFLSYGHFLMQTLFPLYLSPTCQGNGILNYSEWGLDFHSNPQAFVTHIGADLECSSFLLLLWKN